MYSELTFKKIHQVLSSDYESAKHNMIFPIEGGYEVFHIYNVQCNDGKVLVNKYKNLVGNFTSTRTALSWCIADKYNHMRLADEIASLDQAVSRLQADIDTSKTLVKKIKNAEIKEIAQLKLQSKIDLIKEIEYRMDKCVASAKYKQLRGFNDEIERARRTTPNKDYRQGIRVASR